LTKSTFDSWKSVFETGLDKFVSGEDIESDSSSTKNINTHGSKSEIGPMLSPGTPTTLRSNTPRQQEYANPFAVPSPGIQAPSYYSESHTTSAAQVSTTPTHQSSSPPKVPTLPANEDDDDLGFGNRALSAKKTNPLQETSGSTQTVGEKQAEAEDKEDKDVKDEAGSRGKES
jgi:hypothetical protein